MAPINPWESVKKGFMKTFNYQDKEGRANYIVFVIFQALWFFLYLLFYASKTSEIGFIPLLLLILPTLSCAVRRINDAGYSKAIIVLLCVAPYIMLIFMAFPSSIKEKNQTSA